jgi:hypothetical protein
MQTAAEILPQFRKMLEGPPIPMGDNIKEWAGYQTWAKEAVGDLAAKLDRIHETTHETNIKLAELSQRVSRQGTDLSDMEYRIRDLERDSTKLMAWAGLIGAVAGILGAYILKII